MQKLIIMYKSIIEYFADKSASQCGYCRSKNGSYSNGMWGHVMTCQDYQDLIDRGWRRSGRYCYKPTMNKTCCPQYTIKCDATQFQMTKSQKKILKKFRNFIINGGDLPTNDFPSRSMDDLNSDDESDDADFSDEAEEDVEEGKDKMDTESVEQAKALDVETKLKLDSKVDSVQIGGDGSIAKQQPSSVSAGSLVCDATDSGSSHMMTTSDHRAQPTNANMVKAGLGADPSKPKA